jgi:hypothetical protein
MLLALYQSFAAGQRNQKPLQCFDEALASESQLTENTSRVAGMVL